MYQKKNYSSSFKSWTNVTSSSNCCSWLRLNKSNDRRIGFVIQSYIGTNVKQVLGKNSVQLARGVDEFNYHEKIGRPQKFTNDKNDIELKKQENDNLQEIFYKGSDKKGKF
jgi:hypothetical protein